MIFSPAESGGIDPVWYDLFKEVKTKIPVLIVTRLENFKFNENLYKLGDYVLASGEEYGWNANLEETGTHIWGKNTEKFHQFDNDEWRKFDEFVKAKPPLLTMKRELLEADASETVIPLNYPCWHPIPETQTKEQFNNRLFQCNFIWGFSHERRRKLHGEIWQRCSEFDYIICDNIENMGLFLDHEPNPKKWMTVNTPWYARQIIETIIGINGLSKISISLPGAGRHCFRHSESPMNSVMYMLEDGIKYSYPWVNGDNCIKSKEGEEIQTIVQQLNNPDLYEIYRNGVDNCRNYWLPNYRTNYIEKIINSL
jgi:hypothetical protein